MLVSRGTTPEAAKEIAGHAARAIFQNAIWGTKAFSDAVRDKAIYLMTRCPVSGRS